MANAANFTGFAIQDSAGSTEPTFYLDDIQLISSTVPALVHVGVNAAQPLRAADARWFGLNTAIWDSYFDTIYTSNALRELGTHILRFPGGSLSDFYHWNPGVRSDGYQYDPTKFANFVHIATNAGAQAIITVNYGTGTSNEAAAWVTNVKNNNYGFKYWEIGNECYGTWEADSNTYPHDPYTYAVRAAGYIALMKQVDPTIKIGVPVVTGEDSNDNGYSSHPAYNPRTGTYHNGWTPVVLATLKSLGVTPDFLVYHVYPEYGKATTTRHCFRHPAIGPATPPICASRSPITLGWTERTSNCSARKTMPTPAPRAGNPPASSTGFTSPTVWRS